jgi:predicted O-methyltransferase YrrM
LTSPHTISIGLNSQWYGGGAKHHDLSHKWVEEQLVPALPPKSLVVMDNVSYHSVIKEGTKAPTSATRNGGMQKWLKDKKKILLVR